MPKPDTSPVLRYKDVRSLTAARLNSLCRENGIDTKFGKKAKINLLCAKLSISTTGNENQAPSRPRPTNHNLTSAQLADFEQLTPGYLASLEGWTQDLRKLPEVDDSVVKHYLKNEKVIKQDSTNCAGHIN